MKSKSLSWLLAGCLVIIGATLFLSFSAPNSSHLSCKESMENCAHNGNGGSKMIWENLSQQFFSSF